MGGVKGTKYLLKIRNHALRTKNHAPRKTKNSVPPLFFEKAGDNNIFLQSGVPWCVMAVICFTMLTFYVGYILGSFDSFEHICKQNITQLWARRLMMMMIWCFMSLSTLRHIRTMKKDNNARLCAVKCLTVISWILPPRRWARRWDHCSTLHSLLQKRHFFEHSSGPGCSKLKDVLS